MSEQLTFLLTDVERSTALRERFPDRMSKAVARHRTVVTEAVAAHGGRVVRDRGEGDGTFAVFETPVAALEAAATMSRGIAAERWPDETPIRVRIAVYTGEAEERAGDFYGSSVNRAARVRGLAFGGQILVGSDVAARAAGTLPHGSALVDLGPRALKDLSEPEHVYELRLDGDDSEPLSDEGCSNVQWLQRAAPDDFVGREHELDLLAGAWSETTAQRRVLALVAGEPGIGKTALVARAAHVVRADGGLVLHGGWDEDVLAPFQGFRDALSGYAQSCPRSILRADLRDHGAQLEPLFPEIARRIGTEAASVRSVAEAERLRLFEAVDVWLEAMASRRPVMLVLEDVHWADRPSALLLQHLVRGSRPCALLIAATYRDTDIGETDFGRTLPLLSRDRGTLRIALDGLDESNVAELLRRATSGKLRAGAERLVAELRSETGGNPFFLQEMVRHLDETGRLDATAIQERIEVPESVRDIVRWRLSRLSAELGESLAIASVVGQEFDFRVLNAASDIDEDRLLDALDEACRAGLAREDEADRYAFSHAVVRRTLLDDISAARLVRLHRRVGEALEGLAQRATPGELARHFCAAASLGLAEKAVQYARVAGDDAMAELAYEAAVLHYRRALEVHDALGESDGALRCELLLALGGAYDKAGEYRARDEQFVGAAEVARRLDRTDLFVQAALGYGGVLPAAVEPDEQGHALLCAALDRLGPDEVRERALLLGRLAHWMHFAASRVERMTMADEAVTMARSLGDPSDLAVVLTHRGWAMDAPDDLDEQLRIAEEVLELGRSLDDHAVLLEGMRLRTDALFEKGDITQLRAAVDELSRLAEELRIPEYLRIAWTWDAVFATLEGRYEDAALITEKVHDVLRGMGHSQSELVNAALTFPVQWMRGELLEGLPLYEALAQAMPTRLFWPAVVAWCTAEAGMVDKARETLGLVSRDAIRAMDQNYLWWATVVGLTQASTMLGERAWAEMLFELALPYAGRLCTVGSSGFLGASNHYLGELAATLGKWEEAAEHYQDALSTHGDLNARPFVALTQMSYARMLFDRGQTEDLDAAHELQEAAIGTALELGLHAVQNRAALRFPAG